MSRSQYSFTGTCIVPLEHRASWEMCEDCDKVQGMLAITQLVHVPTTSAYTGASRNVRQTYTNWFYRLARLDDSANLNMAIRAVYTTRSDFAFRVLKATSSGKDAQELLYRLRRLEQDCDDMVRALTLKLGRQHILNCGKSWEERKFWLTQVPRNQWRERFGLSFEGDTVRNRRAIKRKLTPRKFVHAKDDQQPYTVPIGNDWFDQLYKQPSQVGEPVKPMPVKPMPVNPEPFQPSQVGEPVKPMPRHELPPAPPGNDDNEQE